MGLPMKPWVSLVLGCAALGAFASPPQIRILDPWVQAAPPNAKVMAAYARIENGADKPHKVIGVASPRFEDVEIHRTVMHGNMAHMEQVKELALPARAAVALVPGGMHMMLIGARGPLKIGDRVPITLTLAGGETLAFEATVRSARAAGAEGQTPDAHSAHKGSAH